jgi:hypothetical protein
MIETRTARWEDNEDLRNLVETPQEEILIGSEGKN